MAFVQIPARDAIRRAAAAGGKRSKGEHVAAYVAAGMIAVSVGLGLYTAKQQLLYAPDVRVRKSRRETLPEVVEPEAVADHSDKFISRSFFRKVAHVRNAHHKEEDALQARKGRLETLKDVGVDPKQEVLSNG